MRKTAVVVSPGRGTYNKAELGTLGRLHSDKGSYLRDFDTYRQELGQETITALDGVTRYSIARHTRGDNASPLIYACGYLDFMSIDQDRFQIVGVTGNSMGWYTVLACVGGLDAMGGLQVVNTMGTLMQESLIGGQLIYPFVDENWQSVPGERNKILAKMREVNTRRDHHLFLSIDLGGMVVLAGNDEGLAAFETEMPVVQDRFPMRLANHAAFHSGLQKPVAENGRAKLTSVKFEQPKIPLIDGRGAIWNPKASNLNALRDYTLGHQVVEPYDFTTAIGTAANELMPDVFIVLGPGTTLGGSVAQALIQCGWRGWASKQDFQSTQTEAPRLISMGMEAQRPLVVNTP